MALLSQELIVVGLSALPIVELRGGIPLAIGVYGMSWPLALLLAVIGNAIAATVLLLILRRAFVWAAEHWSLMDRVLTWAADRAHRNHSAFVDRWERVALFLLVAIPLPFTGAWTGSLVATLAGFPVRRSLFPVLAGVVTAGVIVTLLTTGVLSLGL